LNQEAMTANTRGEIGLAGHWAKLMLHHLFIHKAKARWGWQFIPE
jgi:sulfide:quinone oxidoreductase